MDLCKIRNGGGRGLVSDASVAKSGGTNLDTGGFAQLVRFHVQDITRLAIDPPRMLSICMFCLEKLKLKDMGDIIRERKRGNGEGREEKRRTRSAVRARMAFPPAFCTSVRGITSSASTTAQNGPTLTPVTARARVCRPTEMVISTAPPPGRSVRLKTTLRATDMASTRLQSISFKMSLDGPRKMVVVHLASISKK